jgi:hypothetical protein
MRVLPLVGLRSYQAMRAFQTLMLGLKMLPAYMTESYEDFYDRVSKMDPADQERMIREAAAFVPLDAEESESVLCFCADPNGVPYRTENIKNLGPGDIHEALVAVFKEIAKIKINFVGEDEKKKLVGSA